MQEFKIGDLFTQTEISRALTIWRMDHSKFHDRVKREIVIPAMPRINVRTKQENSPDYLAYLLEFAMSKFP